ncbi:unnamed protein product, partial [Didymodactylos carnosus]
RTTEQSINISSYFNEIEQWSEQDVRNFFHNKNLNLMLLLLQDINGWELVHFYKMCEMDSSKMYLVLNEQLFVQHRKYLPIDMYLRFIRQFKERILG